MFRKTNISYLLIRTGACAYQGVRNIYFPEIWRALFSCNTRFEIRHFALLSTNFVFHLVLQTIEMTLINFYLH